MSSSLPKLCMGTRIVIECFDWKISRMIHKTHGSLLERERSLHLEKTAPLCNRVREAFKGKKVKKIAGKLSRDLNCKSRENERRVRQNRDLGVERDGLARQSGY